MSTVELLGLTRRIGLIGWIIFVVTTAGLLLLTQDAAVSWQNWVAFAAIAAAAALGITGLPGALPASSAWMATALLLLAATLPLWVHTQEYVSFGPWYLRAITEVAAWMVLRQQPLQSWIAAGLASVLAAVLVAGPIAFVRQLATLLAVQVLAIALRRAATAIAAWREEEQVRVGQDEARRVAVATRRAELGAIAARAEPFLRRLIAGRTSAELPREAGLLEASLRDTLRGRRLAVPPLADAVGDARARGVDVALLDDLDGPWSSPSGLSWAASLVAVSSDPITVRLGSDGLTFVSGTSALRHEGDAVAGSFTRPSSPSVSGGD